MGKLSKSIMLGMLSTGLLLSSVVVVDTESTVQAASTINNSKEVSQKAYVSSAKKKLSVYKKRLDENIPKFNEYTAIRKNLPALGNLEDEDYYFEVRHYYIVSDYMSYERSKYISKSWS
ncbi:hypothetical protein [Viridibacillus sp. FSL H8-0123]|uniref:hypothetical protein n=1 Tax=Viridibacillus sp. FSL H8-0123 TaxID=1928922 RepID=UPI00096C884A|nr:hypothetical protein [Viridibacillus sp. FSL H8-0123]OMC77712.1 hypothetical protein BK130_21345 [Viridibacillus sp. FSL H8-0123]